MNVVIRRTVTRDGEGKIVRVTEQFLTLEQLVQLVLFGLCIGLIVVPAVIVAGVMYFAP